MDKIALIKAEIERLKGQLIYGACAAQIEMETNCKDEAYNEVLSFLDTLESEKPMNQEELGEDCETLVEAIATLKKEGCPILSERLSKLGSQPNQVGQVGWKM